MCILSLPSSLLPLSFLPLFFLSFPPSILPLLSSPVQILSHQIISHWRSCVRSDCPVCLPLKHPSVNQLTRQIAKTGELFDSLYSSLVPRPHLRERGSGDIRKIPRASLKLITFWREISLRQSHCRKDNLQCYTGNSWLLRHDDTALFWRVN